MHSFKSFEDTKFVPAKIRQSEFVRIQVFTPGYFDDYFAIVRNISMTQQAQLASVTTTVSVSYSTTSTATTGTTKTTTTTSVAANSGTTMSTATMSTAFQTTPSVTQGAMPTQTVTQAAQAPLLSNSINYTVMHDELSFVAMELDFFTCNSHMCGTQKLTEKSLNSTQPRQLL